MRSRFAVIQEDLVGFGASLADAEDVDGGAVVHRASIFAGATSDTESGVEIGLFDFARIAVTIDDLGGAHVDGFGRSGAPLFADDAISSHSPRQAAAAIIKGGADSDGFGVAVDADDPTFGLGSDLPNGASGTDLRTEHATWLAIADTRNEYGSPQTFEPSLGKRWLQRIVGADFHTFAATDAAREEVGFFQGAWWTEQAIVFLAGKSGGAAHQRNQSCTGSHRGEGLTAVQVRAFDHCAVGEELERQAVVRTRVEAVQAEMALGLAPRHSADRIVATLTGEQAAIAVVASGGIFVQTQDRPTGDGTEQSAKRTDRATPEAGDAIVQCHDEDKQKTEGEALAEVRLFEIEDENAQEPVQKAAGDLQRSKATVLDGIECGIHGIVQTRENREAERTDQKGEGIEPTEQACSERRGYQDGDQEVILGFLPRLVAIGGDELLAAFGF